MAIARQHQKIGKESEQLGEVLHPAEREITARTLHNVDRYINSLRELRTVLSATADEHQGLSTLDAGCAQPVEAWNATKWPVAAHNNYPSLTHLTADHHIRLILVAQCIQRECTHTKLRREQLRRLYEREQIGIGMRE